MTSGAFFERYELGHILGAPQFSLAFIDGMHLFEQAFLDFIALEKYASPASVIMIHDCLPLDRRTSDRTRTTDFYSGDVWKLVWCLKEQRPDLRMVTVRCRPTGLCLVCGLDPHSDALERRRDEHIARYTALSYEDYTNSPSRMPDTIDNNFAVIESWLKDAAMIRDPLRGLLK